SATNVCGCTAESNTAFCSRLMKTCGAVSGTDNCGMARNVTSCGTCTMPQTCGGGGTANVCGGPTVGTTYALVARHSMKCLDVPASSTASGTRLQQFTCNQTDAQQWQLTSVAAGASTIKTHTSGLSGA